MAETIREEAAQRAFEKYKDNIEKIVRSVPGFAKYCLIMSFDRPTGKTLIGVCPKEGESMSHLVSQWYIYQLPGCCGVAVSTAACIWTPFRKLGLNKIFNKMRIEQARESGFSLMLATDISKNEPENKTLTGNGWQPVHDFMNSRTSNKVTVWLKDL